MQLIKKFEWFRGPISYASLLGRYLTQILFGRQVTTVFKKIDGTKVYKSYLHSDDLFLQKRKLREIESCIKLVFSIEKMASFFIRIKDNFQARYKLDVNQVVKKYDAFLQYPLVTTSSFQDILKRKLNERRRALQLTIMLYYWIYMIPRYCFVSFLYFQDEETRMYYQYTLADYAEEMGVLGRTFSACYVIFSIGTFLNDIVIRKFEGQGSLEFLTDWLKRVPKKAGIEDEDKDDITAAGDLDNESRHKLISSLHYKCIFAKLMSRMAASAGQSFHLITFPVFVYKRKPPFSIFCLGLWNCITVLIGIEIGCYYFYSLYLSFVVTTDYFKVLINNIIRKVEELKTKEMKNENVTLILNNYDFMMSDFKKYNRVLKPLLANLVHFYIFGLTVLFFMFTIETEIWMLATTIFTAGGVSFVMLATGVYVSQLQTQVLELHNTLASLCARHAGDKRHFLSLNCMFRLKHIIQELGSLETDGQFVIGLRDGEGPATSRMEIFHLTMETITNTLMVIGFVNGMDGL